MEPHKVDFDEFSDLAEFLYLLKEYPILPFMLGIMVGVTMRKIIALADIFLAWLRIKMINNKKEVNDDR